MPDKPLFEYQFHPPKKRDNRHREITSGPPLVIRFCADGAVQIGIVEKLTTVKGPRVAELFELLAEHMRGPTTSDPDRVRQALQRITAGNPANEVYADLELR